MNDFIPVKNIMNKILVIRNLIATHHDLRNKLEKKYDENFKQVFIVIREMMTLKPSKPVKRIGFEYLKRLQSGLIIWRKND